MRVAFRVDASIQIGTGHVMRALALANALVQRGVAVEFISREHPGSLIDRIRQEGYRVHTLAMGDNESIDADLAHAKWLGASWQQDAKASHPILAQLNPDWLIVDHYAIDHRWQSELRPFYKKLMVIDDLADRRHLCDLLLDQNYGTTAEKYRSLVPKGCQILAGTDYALLRPEFAQWRNYSLKRRAQNTKISTILITMGGVDPENFTGQVLEQIAYSDIDGAVELVVVMGKTAPYLEQISQQAKAMPLKTTIQTDVVNMAELMANADLAIGASGATTWERCCLGLPTIQLVLAENQRQIAMDLAKENIVYLATSIPQAIQHLMTADRWSKEVSQKAAGICDGQGTQRVCEVLS